jgi:hypothetical protein
MHSENQKIALEKIKEEAKANRQEALDGLLILSKEKPDGFVSTVEISCFLYPQCTYESKISPDGKTYKQNTAASKVMNWLKQLVAEGKVETKKRFGSRVYKPINVEATSE